MSGQDPGALSSENNGLLHSCRGGFLDLAHVRDYADLTVYLSAAIERRLETGGVIELGEQGGRRRILVRAVDGERIAGAGRRRLAVALAQWVAFQVSIWHEIATWYGYSSMSTWPEKMSAFTPEDLHSNMLGIQMAAGILATGGSSDDTDYNHAINAWMAVALRRLQVSMAFAPAVGTAIGCDRAGPPLRLRNPSGFEGVRFDHDATLEVEVGDVVAADGLPFPRPGSRRLTQADFPALIRKIRRENAAEFGPGHDRPGA